MINKQTYKYYHLLIIDDGSNDYHKETLNNIKHKYKENKNIIFKENEKNLNIASTLNKGLQFLKDDKTDKYSFFTWISDDNIYHDNFLEKLINDNNYFKYSSFNLVNKINNVTKKINIEYNIENLITGFKGCSSFMWTKEAILKTGFYNTNINGCEDWEYLIRTFKTDRFQYEYEDDSLMDYIRHTDSLYVKENENIIKLKNNIVKIWNFLNNDKANIVYYSKTNYKILFQRPQQIMRFFDKSFNKVFIGNIENVEVDEKYGLLIVPYHIKDCVFNFINNNDKYLYFTDSRLYNEITDKSEYKKIYDLIDAPIGEFEVWKPNLEKCVKNSDYVIYSHPKLVDLLNEIDNTKQYTYISNACDYEHFSSAKDRIGERPTDFPQTDKPILGYYGAFSEWLDFDIIRKYADEENYYIVMIGGIQGNVRYNMKFEHKNITWLDHKSYDELPYYLSWFDKCFLPFKDCELTKYVNPCKLWEYMASEKEIIRYNVNMDVDEIITYDIVCNELTNIINETNVLKFTIGLVGYINYGNFGDELFYSIYKKIFPNCNILVNNFDIDNVDFIIFAGGDLFMTYYFSPVYFNEKFLKKKIYIFSVGIDDNINDSFKKNINKQELLTIKNKYRNFLNHNNVIRIYTRDLHSYNYINYLLIDKSKCIKSTDLSYYIYPNLKEKISKTKLNKKKKILFILKYKDYFKYNDIIKTLLNNKQDNSEITIISSSINGGICVQEDIQIKNKIHSIKFFNNKDDIINVINDNDIIYTSRFHGILISKMLNKKEIYTMSTESKFKNINDDVNLSNEYNLIMSSINDLKTNIIKNIKITIFGSKLYGESDIINHIYNDLKENLSCNFIDLNMYNTKRNKNVEMISKYDSNQKHIHYENKIDLNCFDVVDSKCIITLAGGLSLKNCDKNKYSICINLSDPDCYYYSSKYYNKKFDFSITNSQNIIHLYKPNSKLLNFGVSKNINYLIKNTKKKYDIIIVGGARPERIELLNKLFDLNKYNIKVCGKNWPPKYNAVFVSGKKQNIILNESKIYISFSETIAGYKNIKVGIFEAISSGCVAITNTSKIYKLFNKDEVIFSDWNNNFKNFIKTIDELLANKNLLDKYITLSQIKINKYYWRNMIPEILTNIL